MASSNGCIDQSAVTNLVHSCADWGFSLSFRQTRPRMLRGLRRRGRAASQLGGAMNRTILLAGTFLALFAISAYATDHTVTARSNRTFDPADLTIAVGDTVTFINDPTAPGFHNVESDTGAVTQFRCANGCDGDGAGGSGDPASNTWSATVTFPTAGSVPYLCE